jgi:NAD(P)H-dependent flavin oxidoreductase YrpB (nitropropane dioxygenase family)
MGVAVSDWRLANAVSRCGQLGVVSGSMLDTVFVRRLQDGDPGGHLRRAIAAFPVSAVGDEILQRYFNPAGRAPGAPYKALPMYKQVVSAARQRVTVLANFVEVWLAKEGHDNPVGLNLLTKVQMPNLPSLYGAMLAGVDVVIMGAGIPREIPGALDALANHQPTELRFEIAGLPREQNECLTFDPSPCLSRAITSVPLRRPAFLAVVSAASLATTLARKSNGRVDGFVVEGPTAGGHNAPPRGELRLNDRGEPVYGERDTVDHEKMRALGVPFWLAGGFGSPDGLRSALAVGATGIQVGTLFAFCEQSGLDPALRQSVVASVASGTVQLRTDPRASPTGYPFKIVERAGDAERHAARPRTCDLGYLRAAVRTAEGRVVYRCPAEPVDAYVSKGGDAADTDGRRCLCNGLISTIGQPQRRPTIGFEEIPLVTSGDDLLSLAPFFAEHPRYTAEQVVRYLCDQEAFAAAYDVQTAGGTSNSGIPEVRTRRSATEPSRPV